LPAIDNLTRALSAVGEEAGAGASSDFQNLHTALVMTAKELNKALEQNGIQRLNPLGEPFDPQHHQAMLQVASDALPEGRVAQVLSEGFMLHDRLLKAAYVAVSTGPGPDQSTEVTETAETAETAEMAGSSGAVEPPSAEPH
jgi:molecular chaperone GrpE